MVLAEALVSGAKVVAYDCKSGPYEILKGGKLGLLAKAEDVDDLANQIQATLQLSLIRDVYEEMLRFDGQTVSAKYYRAITGLV